MRDIVFEGVSIKNFRLHEDLEFSFIPNRFVSITGNNGSGKTTILSALTWALYDETTEGIKGDKVVRHRSGKNTCVTVPWTDGTDRYKVVAHRKHHKYKNRRVLTKNDNDISCNTEAETLKLIEELIMPKAVFMNCLLFSQFVKNSFTDLTHAGQREIIDQMLLLKCYDEYSENTGLLIKNAQSKLDELAIKLSNANAQCESKEQMIIREEATHEETMQTLGSQRDTTREQEWQLKKLYIELDGKRIKTKEEELNSKNNELSGQVASLESQLSSQRELCAAEMKDSRSQIDSSTTKDMSKVEKKFGVGISEKRDTIHKLETEISTHEKTKSDLTAQLEQKLSDIKDQKLAELEKSVSPLNEEHQANILSTIKLEEEIAEANRELTKCTVEKSKYDAGLDKDKPTCNSCGQELEDKKALAKIQTLSVQLQDNISELTQTIKGKAKEEAALNNKLATLQSQIDKLRDEYTDEMVRTNHLAQKKREEFITSCSNKVSAIQVALDVLEKQVKQDEEIYDAKIQEIESKRDSLKVSRDTEIKQKHRTTAQKWIDELADLKEQQTTVSDTLDEIRTNLAKADELVTELAGLKSTVEELQNSIDRTKLEHDSRIDLLQEEINKIVDGNSEYQNIVIALERRLKILEFWKKGFSDTGIKAILLDETVPILNERARELCAIVPMLRVRFDSQTQLKSGESRNKFAIEVLHTKNLSSREELSAGEKRMTDIIVLMCLRHLLEKIQDTKINILLLDEILDSLDPENAAIAVGMAKELSDDQCVVLISHTLRDFIEADESLQM